MYILQGFFPMNLGDTIIWSHDHSLIDAMTRIIWHSLDLEVRRSFCWFCQFSSRKKKLLCLKSGFWEEQTPYIYFTHECRFLLVFVREGSSFDFLEINQTSPTAPPCQKNKTENFSIHTFPPGSTPSGCCNSAGLMFFTAHNNNSNLPLCRIKPTMHLL